MNKTTDELACGRLCVHLYIYKYRIPATTESNLFLAIQFPIHLILRACEYTPLG